MNPTLPQQATIWNVTGHTKTGAPTFSGPTTVAARWEHHAELHRDPQGSEFTSNTVVMVPASTVVYPEDRVVMGTSAGSPTAVGTQRIRQIEEIPDIDGRPVTKELIL